MAGPSPCALEEGERIRVRQKTWAVAGWALGLLSFLVFSQGVGQLAAHPDPDEAARARLIARAALLATPLLLVGAGACYARRKGRHAAWGLAGLGAYIGLSLLWFLPGRCRHCGRCEQTRERTCPDCAAPL
jgi:hypothetical protein